MVKHCFYRDLISTFTASSTLPFLPLIHLIDRVTGNVTVSIPSFIPNEMIAAPVGTTHFRFSLAAAEIDFENQVFNTLSVQSAFVVWNNQPSGELDLAVQLPAASTHPLFALLDIEFVQDVNNAKYSVKNGAFNACSIIKVNTPD
jgi:hypothetical protein